MLIKMCTLKALMHAKESLLLLPLILLLIPLTNTFASPDGLKIVTTFPNLASDVKLLACSSDDIESLVPPGVDPHEYELRPRDISLLASADIIISTAHTPFEKMIHEKVASGEIKAHLVEIPKIKGIKIRRNPVTGQPNYHMPIYDPKNYLTFMNHLREIMSELNPSCASTYNENYWRVRTEVERIIERASRMNITAIAVTPVAQYAVEWMGIKVKYLLLKDVGVPATPPELIEMRREAMLGKIDAMILVGSSKTQLNLKAKELARESGIPYIAVPSPLETRSIPDKLSDIISSFSKLNLTKGNVIEYSELPLVVSLLIIIFSLWGAAYIAMNQRSEADDEVAESE